jgi:AcrR family transcriptional regulator
MREALSLAAIKLAVERGLENVLVEDVAAAVDVSPRTFNNYFSSKWEAIAWREVNRAMQIGDLLRARPPEVPIWQNVTSAVLEMYGGIPDRTATLPSADWVEGIQRIARHPLMLGEILKGRAQVVETLAAAIDERLGSDLDHDMYSKVFADAVMSACFIGQDYWLHADPPMPMGDAIREALRQLGRVLQGQS